MIIRIMNETETKSTEVRFSTLNESPCAPEYVMLNSQKCAMPVTVLDPLPPPDTDFGVDGPVLRRM